MHVKDNWMVDSALAKFLIYNGGPGRPLMLTNFSLSKDTHTQHSFNVWSSARSRTELCHGSVEVFHRFAFLGIAGAYPLPHARRWTRVLKIRRSVIGVLELFTRQWRRTRKRSGRWWRTTRKDIRASKVTAQLHAFSPPLTDVSLRTACSRNGGTEALPFQGTRYSFSWGV